MVDIKIDTFAIESELQSLVVNVGKASEKGLDTLAKQALKWKNREIAKTYKRPIPNGKDGNPKWERSGAMRDGQTIESSPGQRVITTVGDASGYEARLANLPTGKDGINRSNPAAQIASDRIHNITQSDRTEVENEIARALHL